MTLSTISLIDDLNEGQAEVVQRTEGPVMVVAGPGSGKTLAIVRRIASLIQKGVSPNNILAVTFTNRAAREMRERLHTLLGQTPPSIFVGTLHLLGLRMIKENMSNSFVVYTREEQIGLLKTLLKGSSWKAADIVNRISFAKSLGEEPHNDIMAIFDEYQKRLSAQKALDFDDLILKPIELLGDKALQKQYRDRFRYIIVDEYQDINPAQSKLLRLLAGDTTNICAVGDPDQAIYAFRGADVENFQNFKKDFPGAAGVTLGLNYRSTGNIVRASGMMIRNNTQRIDKGICAVKKEGHKVIVASVPDERAEGRFIVGEIESRVGGLSHCRLSGIRKTDNFAGSSYCFSDFAVIFRTNNQAQTIEEVLLEAGIPCRALGSRHTGGGHNARDIVGSLKHYANSLAKRDRLFEMKAHELMECFFKDLHCENGQKEALTNQVKLILGDGWAGAMAQDIVDELAILAPEDDFDPRADAVTLMTLHMAKGLEFNVVFISGVEDGFMPYRSETKHVHVEEERRLLYVGMTRAKEELFLIHKRSGYLYGRKSDRSPSPFLDEIPGECVKRANFPERARKSHRKQQSRLF